MHVTNSKINFLPKGHSTWASKIPFISNLKRPACASIPDGLELATIRYFNKNKKWFYVRCFLFPRQKWKINNTLHNIFLTSPPKTTKNEVTEMGWKAHLSVKKILILKLNHKKVSDHSKPRWIIWHQIHATSSFVDKVLLQLLWHLIEALVPPISFSSCQRNLINTFLSDWRYDCPDHKKGFDFFMRLVKRPKTAVKKCQNLIFKVNFQRRKSSESF